MLRFQASNERQSPASLPLYLEHHYGTSFLFVRLCIHATYCILHKIAASVHTWHRRAILNMTIADNLHLLVLLLCTGSVQVVYKLRVCVHTLKRIYEVLAQQSTNNTTRQRGPQQTKRRRIYYKKKTRRSSKFWTKAAKL